jgi:hypothetical protein
MTSPTHDIADTGRRPHSYREGEQLYVVDVPDDSSQVRGEHLKRLERTTDCTPRGVGVPEELHEEQQRSFESTRKELHHFLSPSVSLDRVKSPTNFPDEAKKETR